jgi:hypothetical protein
MYPLQVSFRRTHCSSSSLSLSLSLPTVYDNFGKTNSFEFCLGNGEYRVTASVGRPQKSYTDLSFLSVEGTVMVNNEPTTDAERLIQRTVDVQLNDCCLTFVMGPAEGGTDAFTFMDYIDIEAI